MPAWLETRLDERDVAQHDGQQIVEVVRNPRGELAHCLEPLHLSERALNFLTLLDLRQQLAIGGSQFGGPPDDADFLLLVETAAFILPAAAAQGGLHDADQRGGMERTFQERDVAEGIGEKCGGWIALETAAVAGEQNEREIRPRRLRLNPLRQSAGIGRGDGFLGHDCNVGAIVDASNHVRQIWADLAMHTGLMQDRTRHQCIPPPRRQDQGPFGQCRGRT